MLGKNKLLRKYRGKWITIIYLEMIYMDETDSDDMHLCNYCRLVDYDAEHIEVELEDGERRIVPLREVWQISDRRIGDEIYPSSSKDPTSSKKVTYFHVDVPYDPDLQKKYDNHEKQ